MVMRGFLTLCWCLVLVESFPFTKTRLLGLRLDELKEALLSFRDSDFEFLKRYLEEDGDVSKWLESANERLQNCSHISYLADWNYESNITKETAAKKSEESLNFIQCLQSIAHQAKQRLKNIRPSESSTSEDTLRQLELLSRDATLKEQKKNKRLDDIASQLTEIYANGEVTDDTRKAYSLEPDLESLLRDSRDEPKLRWAWEGWRNVTGKKMRQLYSEMIQLMNEGATENGYHSCADVWIETDFDEVQGLEAMMDNLWAELKPLYEQLHAHVRRRLGRFYGRQGYEFPKDGTIPAHLLGNMWAQQWDNIESLVQPFDIATPNYDDNLRQQKYDVNKMFRTAEDFYYSMGLYNMTGEFWQNSILSKVPNVSMICHASAWDFFTHDDFRIKMCTEINMDALETIHHEMGHVEYYMAYRDQPAVFRRGANGGFHEAIGDTIALSMRTRKHLQRIGLLQPDSDDVDDVTQKKIDINYLMSKALMKIAFLPFGLLIDKWRWKVFRGEITPSNYNTEWWNLRRQYQGLSPPVSRTEEDFDPGAKYHVAASVPYIRYFFSFVVQFQFYESLCKESGHTGPLYQCDFYNSKKAGDKFKRMLQLGGSRPWPEALRELTGESRISARAIKLYFQPLTEWLQQQNGADVGWK